LRNVLHLGPLNDGIYNFFASLAHLQPQAFFSVCVSASLWHHRLGHASLLVINKVVFLFVKNNSFSICSHYQLAKSHYLPFKLIHVSVSKPLELIYSDVWGLASLSSTSGAHYYISILNDATKFLWLFPLKLKSDAHQTFILFQTVMECKFNRKIKALQSIGVVNSAALAHTYTTKAFNIESFISIQTNKLVPLKDITNKLLR
jgi:hypothetical protein